MAPGITADTADINVGAGEVVLVGIYADTAGVLPVEGEFIVQQLTPGAPNTIGYLSTSARSIIINAPGDYRIVRSAYIGHPFGVFQGD